MIKDGPYFIESVEDDKDMVRIILGCNKHGACIEILGSPITASNRVVAILQALNEEQK